MYCRGTGMIPNIHLIKKHFTVFISFIIRGRVFFQSALISFQDFDSHRRAKTHTAEQQGHIRSELMHTSVTEETIECCNSSLDH
jgi:hypothetical protein